MVGSFHLFPARVLLVVGIIRVILRKETPLAFPTRIDWVFLSFALVCMITSCFHTDPSSALVFGASLVFDSVGTYWLLRALTKEWADVVFFMKWTLVLFLPIAVAMLYEKLTGFNPFTYLGATREFAHIRDDKNRAAGPFAHAILAGTVPAVCIPFVAGVWRKSKRFAVLGAVGIVTMVFASTSSGPLLSAAACFCGLYLWKYRSKMRLIIWTTLVALLVLHVIMSDPVWYLLARIDLTGSSTGWHRARLISSALEHFGEWWAFGTDYTRHWMPTGVSWSLKHTDITNYYLKMGVIGGMPLLLAFVAILVYAFKCVSKTYRILAPCFHTQAFEVWCLGSFLFAHCVSMIGVSYFDQSIISLYAPIGIIVSGCVSLRRHASQSSGLLPIDKE